MFGTAEVLKIKPGYEFSSVADVSTFNFNSKTYIYKESDGDFFHQKDIELIDNQVQNLDIVLLHNFGTSAHILGMLIEAPLEGNYEAFMHGESKPDCLNNECIFSDKTFNGNSISYLMNANIVSRIRLWFYKLASFRSDSYSKSTPYHFSIKSTKNYIDTSSKEKVACIDEVFPTKITARRYAHKEIEGAYIVDDHFRVDSFTDNSYSGDYGANNHKSSIIINKTSLLKIIILKEVNVFAYEVTIYKLEGTSSTLVHTASNTKKTKDELETKDIRTSIVLQEGQYTLRIRAMMKGQDFYYNTCGSVKVYVGIMPTSAINIPELKDASNTLPDLGFLLSTNKTISINLSSQTTVNARSDKGFVNDNEVLKTWTIKYLGNTGSIGLYLEIGENLSPNISEEISEITSTIYPDVEAQLVDNTTFSMNDIPIISTSGGKTFMYIKELIPQKTYLIKLLRQKAVTTSSNIDLPCRLQLNAYLYSAVKQSEIKKASVEIDGMKAGCTGKDWNTTSSSPGPSIANKVVIPINSWQPACSELVLTSSLLKDSISNTLKSGLQYQEIVVLNEEVSRISAFNIDISQMKDAQGSIMISASPYTVDGASLLEEFMISAMANGAEKQTIRSQEFEENVYMLHFDLSKSKFKNFNIRINYSINDDPSIGKNAISKSQCNMIRLNIQYIPANKQIVNQE